jgi:CxxC motif-containing protein (DUF1111 family)
MRSSPRTLPVLAAALWAAAACIPATTRADGFTAKERTRIAAVTRPTTDFTRAENYEQRPAGASTVFGPFNRDAFSAPSANISFAHRADFDVGNGIFHKLWVSAPSSTMSSDGLGPLYNARGCQSCHLKDGRGNPPAADRDDPAASMVMGLGLGGGPDPVYGNQFQTLAVQGIRSEGLVRLSTTPKVLHFADGGTITLARPDWRLVKLNYGPLDPNTVISPRVAPPMIGVGLLEAIDPADILAQTDPDDRDHDGISGRANMTTDPETGKPAIGRFGWKAGQPSVSGQASTAFFNDMGIASPLRPMPYGDCTKAQTDCRAAPNGAEPGTNVEISQDLFDLVVFYSRNLAVPARRDGEALQVLAGKKLFYQTGCISCHRPKFVTRRMADRPGQSFQLIWPYTDLLLHDMGDDLADRTVSAKIGPDASAREWRTPPLWGMGLTRTVNGHDRFLHDGRARGFLEAVLWHGGEAAPACDRVLKMTRTERDALVAFLSSL